MTNISAVPCDELNFSLTGGKALEKNDLPQYFLPALCLAVHAIHSSKSGSTKVPEALSKFYNRCCAAIQSSTGQQVETFLDLELNHDGTSPNRPSQDCKQGMKARNYTPDEIKYIAVVW